MKQSVDANALAAIKLKVYNHCGLLLEGIAEERLRKAVYANLKVTACDNLASYYQLLSSNPKVLDQLVGQLTVNETYFFREPEQIRLLVKNILPQILANKAPGAPVRLLSAGCSSGEEPYSLAIALREALGATAASRIHIDAGDLDYEILKKAETGLYSDFSFRGVDAGLRRRYFKLQTRGQQLVSEIRQQVNFHQLNLLAPVFPRQLNHYDIIFFRNVSIYFDLETRLIIQKKFYELMNEDAVLLLGGSETLGNDLGVFELVEQKNQYYFIKGKAYHPDSHLKPDLSNQPTSQPTNQLMSAKSVLSPALLSFVANLPIKAPSKGALPDLKNIQQLIIDGKQARALQLLDVLLASNHGGASQQAANLLKSWVLLNNQEFELAKVLLDALMELDPWSVDALLMKGLSCKWQQQIDDAIQWFKKLVYSCPECWPAHYFLADMHRHEQSSEAAIRSYQTVLRILNANPFAADCTQWIPIALPAGHAMFLSRRHLQQLTASLSL